MQSVVRILIICSVLHASSISDAAISATHTWTFDALLVEEPIPVGDEQINFLKSLEETGDFYGPERAYSRSESISISRFSTGFSSASFNFLYNIQDTSTTDHVILTQNISRSSFGIGGITIDGRGSITTRTIVTYDENIQLEFRAYSMAIPGDLGPLNMSAFSIRDITTGLEIFPRFEFEGFSTTATNFAVLENGRSISTSHLSGFWSVDISLPENNTTDYQLEVLTGIDYAFSVGHGFNTMTGNALLTVVPEGRHWAALAGLTVLAPCVLAHKTRIRRTNLRRR